MLFHIPAKHMASIILTVSAMAAFLSIFFFTYAAKIEKKVIQNQMNYITNQLLDEFSVFIPDSAIPQLKALIDKINVPDLSVQDEKVKKANNIIFQQTLKIIIIVMICALVVTFGMSRYYDFSYINVLMMTGLSIAVVAIIEYVFLTFFASKYLSADFTFVKYKILDTIQKNII